MLRASILFLMAAMMFASKGYACPEVPQALETREEGADPDLHTVYEEGIWALWYHPAFFDKSEARFVARRLEEIRCDALDRFGLQDPPAISDAERFPVFLHTTFEQIRRDDGFPDEWDTGLQSQNGRRFLTLKQGSHDLKENLDHQGFHVFQLASPSAYEQDPEGRWYAEASASWYATSKQPTHHFAYLSLGALAAQPFKAMWDSQSGAPNTEIENWTSQKRHQALHPLLEHLVQNEGLPSRHLLSGYYDSRRDELPQESFARHLGHDGFADGFTNFAAWVTATIADASEAPLPDWLLTEKQREFAVEQLVTVVEESDLSIDDALFALSIDVDAERGRWLSPPVEQQPQGFGYNVIQLYDPVGQAELTIDGDDLKIRLVTWEDESWVINEVHSGDELDLDDATTAYLVIAYTPPVYRGQISQDYRLKFD